MQRVAPQLVPEMNRVTAAHDEKRARLTRGLERAVDDAEAATLRAEIAQEGRLHDAALEELEAQAAAALAKLESDFEEAAAEAQAAAALRGDEAEKLRARLARLDEAAAAAAERAPSSGAGGAALAAAEEAAYREAEGARLASQASALSAAADGAAKEAAAARDRADAAARAGRPEASGLEKAARAADDRAAAAAKAAEAAAAAAGEGPSLQPAEWVMARLAFLFEEEERSASRSALRRWRDTQIYMDGKAAGGGGGGGLGGSSAELKAARAERVRLLSQVDALHARLESASLALAVRGGGGVAGDFTAQGLITESGAEAAAGEAAAVVAVQRRELAATKERLRLAEQAEARGVEERDALRRRLEAVEGQARRQRLGGAAPVTADDALAAEYERTAAAVSAALVPGNVQRGNGHANGHANGGGDARADLEALEEKRAALEASLSVQRAAAAEASALRGFAEANLANQGAERPGSPNKGGRATMIGLQQQHDEAAQAQADAELSAEQLAAQLRELAPALEGARAARRSQRVKAETALSGRNSLSELSTLPLAHAAIELLQERLRAGGGAGGGGGRGDTAILEAQVAALQAELDARAPGGGGGGGGGGDMALVQELHGLQARYEERGVELQLALSEKGRLQRMVDELSRGEMAAVYERAKEEAEKEVLKRMLSTDVDLKM